MPSGLIQIVCVTMTVWKATPWIGQKFFRQQSGDLHELTATVCQMVPTLAAIFLMSRVRA